jgi:spermidine synthase
MTAKENRKVRQTYIYVLSFFSGMCIMAVELSASRLVAPFFGSSTYVWTNIIAIIMTALSIGYFVGGKLADRRPDLDLLIKLLILASLFLIAIPFAAPFVSREIADGMKHFSSSFSYIFFGSMITISLLFLVPVIILGMTSPFLIRLLAEREAVGGSAGRIFGISTLGSIIGTFLPVLLFIPTLGTAKTILFFGATQFLISIIGLGKWRYSIPSVLLVLPLLFPLPLKHEAPGTVYATESAYQYMEVIDRYPYRYLVYNDGVAPQTAVRRDSMLTGYYYDYYSLLPYLSIKGPHVLLIGLGGGTIANQLTTFYPSAEITAVEIDPKVIEVAKNYFSLTKAAKVYNQDGRIFESFTRPEKYNIVIIDAYTHQIYIPFHLTTVEFFTEVRKSLLDNGIVAMNVASGGSQRLVNSITNTLHQVFGHVYRVALPNGVSNIIIASDHDVDFGSLVKAADTQLQDLATYTLTNLREVNYDSRYPILTDDKAPVELMVDWELISHK